jgi:hypothetical protein
MTYSQTPEGTARPVAASLKIAYAVAKQRAQDLHFHGVMQLIERARGEVAAPQALTIYARLHNLSEPDTQVLKNRVMVHMGRATDAGAQNLPHTFVAIDGAVEWDISASLVERIRKRVGGRRRHALREWIELHSGSIEGQLLRLHVECLRSVREAVGPDARLEDMVHTYAREQGIRDSMHDALYYAFLEQLFEELAQAGAAAGDPAGGTDGGAGVEEVEGGASSPLRIAR